MKQVIGKVMSVHAGDNDDLSKEERPSIRVELDGIVGDRHRAYQRTAWQGDKQAAGTVRRNERQWSAVSLEELAAIRETLDLAEPLRAATLGANICLAGIDNVSRLPRATLLKFPSGAALLVEEYNPPCHDMGKRVAATHRTRAGNALPSTAFPKAAKLLRGVVGVVEVAGAISTGDEVVVDMFEAPSWLAPPAD